MFNRLQLFVLTGLFSLVAMPVLAEEVQGSGGAREQRDRTKAADLIAQGMTRVTGVEVNQTAKGLELVLKTVAGSERLVPLILPEGNDLVIDLLDATLAFSIRNGVTETNPAPGINKITEQRSTGTIDIFNASAFEPATDEPFELQFEGEFTTESFGIFLQDQIAILDNFQLVIGGRFDTVDTAEEDFIGGEVFEADGDDFTPRVGIVYQPIEPVSLYASFSQSFFPSFGTSVDGEAFEPTKGTVFEIGVKSEIIKDKLSSTLALYDTTLTNVATEYPDNPDFEIQTGEQNSQGIELDIAGEILPGWNIFAGYAYTDAKVTEDNVIPEGNRLVNVPENNFNLWTTYTLQKGSLAELGFGAGVFFIDERAGDLDNSFFVDGYTRVDAAIYYEKENYRAAVNFKNLFNADFIEGTSSRQRIQPGAPFAVQGTVSAKF